MSAPNQKMNPSKLHPAAIKYWRSNASTNSPIRALILVPTNFAFLIFGRQIDGLFAQIQVCNPISFAKTNRDTRDPHSIKNGLVLRSAIPSK
ncbi:MAG: hypothetical protein AAGK92_04580 [Pseudomonadota bacterium]